MSEINWLAVGVVTVGTWIFGALWFGPIWGKVWMRIHHGDKTPSNAEMAKMSEGMWKLLVTEFLMTGLMMIGLACIIGAIPQYSGVQNAFMIWLAFVMPEAVSSVLWGKDDKKWMPTKIALMTTGRLIPLLGAGYILSIWR